MQHRFSKTSKFIVFLLYEIPNLYYFEQTKLILFLVCSINNYVLYKVNNHLKATSMPIASIKTYFTLILCIFTFEITAMDFSNTVIVDGIHRTHAQAVALLVKPLRGTQPHRPINYQAQEMAQERTFIAQERKQAKIEQARIAQEHKDQMRVAKEQAQIAQAQAKIAEEQAQTAMALAQIAANLAAMSAAVQNAAPQASAALLEHKENSNEERSDLDNWQIL